MIATVCSKPNLDDQGARESMSFPLFQSARDMPRNEGFHSPKMGSETENAGEGGCGPAGAPPSWVSGVKKRDGGSVEGGRPSCNWLQRQWRCRRTWSRVEVCEREGQ